MATVEDLLTPAGGILRVEDIISAVQNAGKGQSVDSFGAVGDGVTNDKAAIQAAIDDAQTNGGTVTFTPGKVYRVGGTLVLHDYTHLVGSVGFGTGTTTAKNGPPKLVFDNATGNACFDSADPGTPLLYVAIAGLTIRVETAYAWVFDLKNLTASLFRDIRVDTVDPVTAGFRSHRLHPTYSSWVNTIEHMSIRLPDAGTGRPLDIQWSDSRISNSAFTGGIGSLMGGAGAVSVVGTRFDLARGAVGAAALTIDNPFASDYIRSMQIIGCEIEESDIGILVYAETTDELKCMPLIMGCHFRCPSGTDIKLNNVTGQIKRGPLIVGNLHTLTSARRINWDPARWDMPWPAPYVWKRETANPIASHTGDTAVTEMVSIPIKARMLGQYGGIRVTSLWSFSNDTFDKYLTMRIGLTKIARYAVTLNNARSARFVAEVWNQGGSPASQVGWADEMKPNGESLAVLDTATVDTDVDFTISLLVQLFDAAASADLRHYNVEILPG